MYIYIYIERERERDEIYFILDYYIIIVLLSLKTVPLVNHTF